MSMEYLQSISDLFEDKFFQVPDYQRGYAWEERQWQDLWDDLEFLENNHDHYTGTLILKKSSDSTFVDDAGVSSTKYDVVDGQQRLITLSILIKEIAEQNKMISKPDAASTLYEQYLAVDKDGKPYTKLKLNRDTNEYYVENIVCRSGKLSAGPRIFSERRLSEAANFFSKKFAEKKSASSEDEYSIWLTQLEDKVLKHLKLTVYPVPDDLEVGVVFEVMNNRGRELTEMEKVKNYLLYASSKVAECGGETLAEEINSTWKYINETIMDYELGPFAEDALLRFNWLITENPRTRDWKGSNGIKAKLSIRGYGISSDPEIEAELRSRKVALREDIRQYINRLEDSCKAYCDIERPHKDKAFIDVIDLEMRSQIIEHSEKLARMRTTATFIPMLIAARLCNATPQEYLDLLKLCEKYAFRVFKLADRRTNAGQSALYRAAHHYYKGDVSLDSAKGTIRQLLTHFCNQSTFNSLIDTVGGDWYNWSGIKYLLFEYEIYLAKGARVDLSWEDLHKKDKTDSIEHILPQTPKRQYWKHLWPKHIRDKYTHDIGNLVVTLDNQSYSNKPFPDKKGKPDQPPSPCYINSSLFSERELAQYKDWDKAAFEDRRQRIASWMKERWAVEDFVGSTDYDEDEDEEIAPDALLEDES